MKENEMKIYGTVFKCNTGGSCFFRMFDNNGRYVCTSEEPTNCKDCHVLSSTPKDLLTVGRVVELRDGTMGFVLPDRIISENTWFDLKHYREDALYNHIRPSCVEQYDIVEIFDCPIKNKLSWNFGCYDKYGLVSVWKREEKSPEQIEKEAIQIEMEKLAQRLKQLEVK
jgi:hypothetical protein